MIYLYFPRFTWIAICTLLSLTGVRGDGSEVNSIFGNNKGVNFAYNTNNVNHVTSNSSVERNRRSLLEVYLIREKKENEDPMNYLSKLSSDIQDSSTSPYQKMLGGSMIEGIIDPPQIELQFHKKVPNCASEFNITKILELVEEDKKQRICPCTSQLSKPDATSAEGAGENMQAPSAPEGASGGAAEAAVCTAEPQQPPAAPSQPAMEEATTCQSNEFSAESSTQSSAAQAGQVAVVSKAEVPGPKEAPKPAEQAGGAKAPKPDQSKAAISQKKLDDKQKLKATAPRPAQPAAPRVGPPVSRVSGDANKKGGPMLQPRPPAAAAPGIRPPTANMQMKNALKTPQQIANRPLHSELPDARGQPKRPALPGHAPQKLMNAKQQIVNPGWDLAEPGAAYPGLYQFRQP